MRFSQEISIFNPFAINRAVVSLGTSITQTAQEIRLEAQRTYTTQDQTRAWISVKADEITSMVEDNYPNNVKFQSAINQTPHSIELSVSNSGVINKQGSASAGITITMKDKNGNIIDSSDQATIYINGSVVFTNDLGASGTTKIDGGRIATGEISLDRISGKSGTLTISTAGALRISAGNFRLDEKGNMTTYSGRIGQSSNSANYWTIGGGSSGADNRAWIYSGSKSNLSSKNVGIYIGTDGIEVREGSGVANSWTRIVGGVTETTQLKIYDGGGTRYGTMVISDETRDMPSQAGQYFRIGFSNGIVTGASGEDRGGNIFLNRTWCYNHLYARRDVTFGDNDSPGSSDYGYFRLYQNGTYYADWSPGSDRRLKKNISHINHKKARDFILALKPSEYQLVHVKDGRYHHGFIAQEVEEIGWDGLVGHDEQHDNMRSLAYIEIIPDIVAVLQDLLAEREG